MKPLEVSITTRDLKDAQVGDNVIVQLVGRPREGERAYGKVVEVTERATNSFVGTYDEFDGQGYVKIDGRNFEDPITVGDPGAKGAAPGDKVVIEMLRFPSHAHSGEAVLTRVLGAKGRTGCRSAVDHPRVQSPRRVPARSAARSGSASGTLR